MQNRVKKRIELNGANLCISDTEMRVPTYPAVRGVNTLEISTMEYGIESSLNVI